MRTSTLRPVSCFLLIAVLFLLVSAEFGRAATDSAFIKIALKKKEKIWPGQQQTLYVKLYTTKTFGGSTRFDLPKVSGMLFMESEDRPLLGTEKVDGVSYVYKQHEIILFPQRAGHLTIPPFNVDFAVRGLDSKLAKQSFSTAELQFTVKKVPGADPQRPLITTPRLVVDDHWDPLPEQAKVGDAFIRTISMTADDLPGMAFPPFSLERIDGLGVYIKQPRVEDRMQRGEFSGKRIETISYVCEQEGVFSIPAVQIQWWNPESELLQNIVLEAVELKVAANPLLQQESPVNSGAAKENKLSLKWLVAILFITVLAGSVFLRQRRKTGTLDSQVKDRENELFHAFKEASATHDAAATMQALLHWLDYSNLSVNSGDLAYFIESVGDPILKQQVRNLETTLYADGQEQQWSGDSLYKAVKQGRKKLQRKKSCTVLHALPTLNP